MAAYGTPEGFALFLGEEVESPEESGRSVAAELLEEIRAIRRMLENIVDGGAPLAP